MQAPAHALLELAALAAAQGPDGLHRGARTFHLALLGPCRLLAMFESAWNATELGRPMAHASSRATAALIRLRLATGNHGEFACPPPKPHSGLLADFGVSMAQAVTSVRAGPARRRDENLPQSPARP